MCVNAVDAALRTPAPTLACKVVMLCLAHHKNFRSGLCFVSGHTLAEETGLDIRSVRRAVARLANPEEGEEALIRILPAKRAGSRSEVSRYVLLFARGLSVRALQDHDEAQDELEIARIEAGTEDTESERPRARVTLDPVQGDSRSRKVDAESPKQDSTGIQQGEDARSRELSEDQSIEEIEVPVVVDLIWKAVGDLGRKRSAKSKVQKALEAALKRRPKSVGAEDHLKRILEGIRAYLSHPDTKKEGGRYEHGAHRTLENDVWASFLDDDGHGGADTVAAGPLDPEVGTSLAPGPKLQRYWAETARQGLPWDPARGPRPEMAGCRISPEIQREFGFQPHEGAEPLQMVVLGPKECTVCAQPFTVDEHQGRHCGCTVDQADDDSAAFD